MIINNDDDKEFLSLDCQNSTLELPLNERFRFKHLRLKRTYIRKYSFISIVLIFFAFSFFGWLWESLLQLLMDGKFANRGMLFGPWLPIYGFGGLLALFIPKKILKNPVNAFFVIAILSSIIEYATSWFFEYTRNTRWWDYSNYILNINGRVCLLSAIFFGLGGCLGVYFLGPMLDDMIKKLSHRTVLLCCITLIFLFSADLVYSKFVPNVGRGITDYSKSVVVSAEENSYPDYILEV